MSTHDDPKITQPVPEQTRSPLQHDIEVTPFRSPTPLQLFHASSLDIDNATAVNSNEPLLDQAVSANHSAHNSREYEKQALQVPDWPSKPATFKKGWALFLLRLVLDIVLVMLPLLFIFIAAAAIFLNGRAVESIPWGKSVVLLSGTYGVTIFPILFATLVGTAMTDITSYLLEKGASLLLLEQLAASVSIGKTVSTQAQLRAFNWQAVALICLWALSPLGGQGSLRLLRINNGIATTSDTITYVPTNGSTKYSSFVDGQETLRDLGAINGLTISSFASLNASNPVDIWGNMRIPNFQTLASSTERNWVDVPSNTSFYSYVGIPYSDPPTSSNSTFSIVSRHLQFDCTPPAVVAPSLLTGLGFVTNQSCATFPNIGYCFTRKAETDVSGTSATGLTTFGVRHYERPDFGPSTNGSGYRYSSSPRTLAVMFIQTEEALLSNCTVYFPVFESSVHCTTSSSCLVKTMRNISDDYKTLIDSPLEYIVSGSMEEGISDIWPSLRDDVTFWTYFEVWFSSGISPYLQTIDGNGLPKISNAKFTERFTALMNTRFQASISPGQSLNFNSSFLSNYLYNSTAVVTSYAPTYATDSTWLIILFICSFVLLLVGAIGTVLRYMTVSNPLISFVSTLTLNNSDVYVPSGGATLTGYERTRLLGDLKLKVCDLQPEDDVGRIGVASVNDEKHVGSLSRTRLYA